MPIVQAYQCAFTGALFADRADYCAHVKEVGLERGREKRIEKLEAAFQRKVAQLSRVGSFAEIVEWIEENGHDLVARNEGIVPWAELVDGTIGLDGYVRNVEFSLKYDDCVSNTHSYPRDGVQNWHRDPKLPAGYPGWRGRMRFETNGSFCFQGTGINTGTGSGNHLGKYGCDVKLFSSDFPNLAMASKLRGELDYLSPTW